MSLLLSVYTKNAFEEILLPSDDNTDFSFMLDSDRYHLEDSIEVKLEVVDGQWRILESQLFQVLCQNTASADRVLAVGDILNLRFYEGPVITVAVTDAGETMDPLSKYSLVGVHEITVGKAQDNVICLNGLGLVSSHHAKLIHIGSEWVLEDISRNGTYVGKERVEGKRTLRFGDCINIFGTRIVFLGSFLAINDVREGVVVQNQVLKKVTPSTSAPPSVHHIHGRQKFFRRAPRNVPQIFDEPVEIEAPPALQETEKRPLLLTIGPSFTMAIPMLLGCMLAIYGRGSAGGGVFMYTGVVTAVASALLGVMWALLNLRYTKKKEAEQKQLRFEAYSDYLIKIANFLKEKQEFNFRVLHEAYPAADVCARYTDHDPQLWNRNFKHDDFLRVRVGLGDVPFQVPIKTPAKRFSLITDPMVEKPFMLQEEFKTLKNVPISVDLFQHQVVGIVDPNPRGGFAMARNIIVQLAASHCYTEVKMAFVGKNSAFWGKAGWDFARWLPHTWSEDRRTRFFARTNQECRDVLYELSCIFRNRAEEEENQGQNVVPKPYYIVFVENAALLEDEPVSKYLLEPKPNYGVTTVFLSESYEGLPNACQYIIQADNEFSGMYNVANSLSERLPVRFDSVSGQMAEDFARGLSSVRVNELESGGDIPAVLDFFDMMGVDSLEALNVAERWKKNRTYDSMRVLIGKKGGGSDCYLDIHEKYHGPHGLVAGTTGSGKSETLQTYILSLAINYSPLDVAFLLIDFKGGGMANLFADLPHTVGRISNLSGSQIRRAMVSIKSENLRRQRIFGEYGVNHIDAYMKLYKNQEASVPIPHMLIVIDEFAELKREEPDFMRELISVAQVGRSLGVHLILATQKPGGTVDDSIRSNTKFRLCLRVQDRQDSAEMLHKPDAAYITRAGRGYLQVGNDEVYELFQSGWSGAKYDPERNKTKGAAAKMIDSIGHAAMAGSRSEILRMEQQRLDWAKTLIQNFISAAVRINYVLPGDVASRRDEYLDAVIDDLRTSGANYLDSSRNRIQLQKMLALWPKNQKDPKQITAQIVRGMEMLGEKLPDWQEKTQLDAVVEHLSNVAKVEHKENTMRLWLPPLPEELYLSSLPGGEFVAGKGGWLDDSGDWTLETPVGLCDAPENQMQIPLNVDFANNGHYAICGVVDCGKSTFLQTLIYGLVNRYSPKHLNVYALDFSSGKLAVFEGLAHVGGVLGSNQLDSVQKFFNMLSKMLDERQKLFAGADYRQYIKTHGKVVPAVLVAIDQYANFREKTDNEYDALIMRLSSVGVSCGIYMAITAGGFGTNEIPNRLAENIRTTLALEMGDKFKYGDVLRTMHFSTMPEANIKGRGLVNLDGNILEYQTALAIQAEDDYKRSSLIAERCKELNELWGSGVRARAVPVIPEEPVWEDFSALATFQDAIEDDRTLPLGYFEEDASIYGADLSQTFCYLVSGRARSGRTTTLRLIIESAARKGGRVVVIDNSGSELKRCADRVGATYIQDRDGMLEFVGDLYKEFPVRNKKKRALVETGASPEEIYNAMADEERVFVVIHDLGAFIEDVYTPPDPSSGMGAIHGFIENVIEKGKLHQVYFFAGFDSDKFTQYSGRRAFNAFCDYRTGVHLGGELDRQRIFAFDNVPYADRSRATTPGFALASSFKVPNEADRVILPQWRG